MNKLENMKILTQKLRLPLTLDSARFAPLSTVAAQGTAFTYQGQLTGKGAPARPIETSDLEERTYR
jgi:hypothetical protein